MPRKPSNQYVTVALMKTRPVRGYRDIKCLVKTRVDRWDLVPHCYLICGLTCAKNCTRYGGDDDNGICEGCPCTMEEK